jgi:hypothetical protein
MKNKIVPKRKDYKETLVGILAFAAGVCYLLWKIIRK